MGSSPATQSVWTRKWDLRFCNRRTEHNFWTAFSEQSLWADRIYCLLCTFIWTLPTIKLFLTGASTMKYGLAITGANALVAAMQCLVPNMYMRHRTAICLCLKICSSFCASAIRSAPTSKEADGFLAFASYMIMYSKALLLILSGWIGLPIPFLVHVMEHSVSLGITLLNNPSLCGALKLEQPSVSKRLTLMCEGLSFMAIPFNPAAQPLVLISPLRRCEWAFAWIQTCAFLASCALVYRAEANSRRAYEVAHSRSDEPKPLTLPWSWVFRWVCLSGFVVWCALQGLDRALDTWPLPSMSSVLDTWPSTSMRRVLATWPLNSMRRVSGT